MKLVIYPPVDEIRCASIQAVSEIIVITNCPDEATAESEISDASAFFGKLTPAILAAAKELRWVQSPTASLEHFIFPELIDHPCVLTNMRGIYSDVIADHVLGYVLCFARNLHLYLRQQVRCHYEPIGGEAARATFAAGPGTVNAIDKAHLHVADCTLGIVGLGAIGLEIARRARAFDMRVIAVDPVDKALPEGISAVWAPEQLNRLLEASDFVVIAAPHTPDTERMFRSAQFAAMKNSAYLINIGRGAIVDLSDLVVALNDSEIAGAALDVFETEPLPSDHPLWQMANVLMTPHVAAASVHIAERHLGVVVENVRRFVAGKPLINIADKTRWF
ncbi:MAG: D-2-hydroxyacid dehydrogenase [Pseudomonadota bacterium]|jgi:phosphoglycerate dehydrogenase-like enzyme|nr:D-2-hydroxyacid dehydrogenase [Pseudomonadota bacterium]